MAMSVDANGEPVEGGGDAARKLGLEIRVGGAMSEMREKRPFGAHGPRGLDRLGNAEMRGMFGLEERVDHEHRDTPQRGNRAGSQTFRVGDVPERPDAVRHHVGRAVWDRKWQDLDVTNAKSDVRDDL